MPSQTVEMKTAHTVINAHFADLRGKLLTIIESIVPEGQQCDAAKALARREMSEIQTRMNTDIAAYLEENGYVGKRTDNR